MTRHIPAERFSKEIFDLLDETFERHHGIYLDEKTSFFETLEGIPAAHASRAASPSSASIAAHVKHVRFYLDVLESLILERPPARVDWGEIWRTTREVTPEEWAALKQELRASYERLLATLRERKDWAGENDIGGALAILAHSACHLGAIRQALIVIRSSP